VRVLPPGEDEAYHRYVQRVAEMSSTPLKANRKFLLKHDASILIILIFIFHAVNTVVFVLKDTAPMPGQEGEFLWYSRQWLDALISRDTTLLPSGLATIYPPLHLLMALPFYMLGGFSPGMAILSSLPAALVLVVSVYHLGKELHSKQAGIFAAALTMLLPDVFAFSRTFHIEFTLTATVALSLALMLKSRGFSKPFYTLAFGLSVALGLLTKPTFTPFVIGPLFLYAISSYLDMRRSRQPPREMVRRAAWLAGSLLLGILLASVWYIPRIQDYIFRDATVRTEHAPPELLNMPVVAWYFSVLPLEQLGFLLLVLSTSSFAYLFVKRRWSATFLALWIVIPCFMFILLFPTVRNPRYMTPYLPSFALIVAVTCMSLRSRWRKIAMSLVLSAALLQFFAISYFWEPVHPLRKEAYGHHPSIDRRDWRLEEIRDTLRLLFPRDKNATVLIHHLDVYSEGILYYLKAVESYQNLRIERFLPCDVSDSQVCEYPYEHYAALLEQSDVVLVNSALSPLHGSMGGDFGRVWNDISPTLIPVQHLILPDGENYTIYMRNRQSALG